MLTRGKRNFSRKLDRSRDTKKFGHRTTISQSKRFAKCLGHRTREMPCPVDLPLKYSETRIAVAQDADRILAATNKNRKWWLVKVMANATENKRDRSKQKLDWWLAVTTIVEIWTRRAALSKRILKPSRRIKMGCGHSDRGSGFPRILRRRRCTPARTSQRKFIPSIYRKLTR